ncbi:MAG: TylF/MycF/NovP-related O-methyltransferase [Solirubrobacteraceae bacterium]|nr:TylF/MycF/NovP-related O-methyltransferase [Solirubrobacteraceae bacterium]
MRAFLGRIYRAAIATRLSEVSRQVRRERLTYLPPQKLRSLERLVAALERDGVDGSFIECGVALGGSAIVLAKLGDRPFAGYDVFGMMPAPGPDDPPSIHARYAEVTSGRAAGIGGDDYYGYRDDLVHAVEQAFASAGLCVDGTRIALHAGLFEHTLRPERPVALAHIDCDRHDPVALCLERIWPVLSPGGVIVLDDYTGAGACGTATDTFLDTHSDATLTATRPHGIIRKR